MRVAIDVDGTFTDLVADDGRGNAIALKVASSASDLPSGAQRSVLATPANVTSVVT